MESDEINKREEQRERDRDSSESVERTIIITISVCTFIVRLRLYTQAVVCNLQNTEKIILKIQRIHTHTAHVTWHPRERQTKTEEPNYQLTTSELCLGTRKRDGQRGRGKSCALCARTHIFGGYLKCARETHRLCRHRYTTPLPASQDI